MEETNSYRNSLDILEREKIVSIASQCLFSDEGKEALLYLKNRGLSDVVLKKFKIGYVPSYVSNKNGIKHELSGRIVYPIFDQNDKLVALSSRDWRLSNNKSANRGFWHEAFPKKFYLYGLNIAKESIMKYNKSIVVEGEIDTLAMHSHLIDCTVGVQGSNLGLIHVGLLSRYCSDIYLFFDEDGAGNRSMDRCKLLYKENRLDLYNINFIPVDIKLCINEKIDPDEILKNYGRKKIIDILKLSKEKYVKELK